MEYIIIAIVVAFVGYSIFKESKPTTVKKTPAKQRVKKNQTMSQR